MMEANKQEHTVESPRLEEAIHILKQLVHGQAKTKTARDVSDQTIPSGAVDAL